MKTHFRNFTVLAIAAGMSFLVACKKEQDHASSLTDYKVTDRTLVNNEDGRPRTVSTLPVLSGRTVALDNENLNAGQVTVKNAAGKNLLLTITGNKDGELTLTQTYTATEGQASGTVYYTLIKN